MCDTLPSEQFSAHFGVCCVLTPSIVKSTDANRREFRQKSYEIGNTCLFKKGKRKRKEQRQQYTYKLK